MVITIPAQERPLSGPRPINLNKDLPQVIKLLELAFGHRLSGSGQKLFRSETGLSQPKFLWRLNPVASKLALGYVWEEDGRIVGNATLISTRKKGRYLVVNVAVHPDYRHRGIARSLMDALLELIKERNGNLILLQVVKDNMAAINLYHSMHFESVGNITSWRCSQSQLRDLEPEIGDRTKPIIQALPGNKWQSAYKLDIACLPPDLNWPEPLPQDAYKTGIWRRFDNFLNGRHAETWMTMNEKNQLSGLASIWSEWGHPHQVTLRVLPTWQGILERPLLAKIIRRLQYLPRRNIRLDHPAEDELVNKLLRETNFTRQRTLTHMRLDVS